MLAGVLRRRCHEGPLANGADWYNDDQRLKAALTEMLEIKRGLCPGGAARQRELAALDATARKRFGFGDAPAAAQTQEVAAVLEQLESPVASQRSLALLKLQRLGGDVLAPHAASLLVRLSDEVFSVRGLALWNAFQA